MENINIIICDKEYSIPLEDYLEIKSIEYGFDSYEDLKKCGLSISFDE